MGTIFSISSDKNLLLYSFDTSICLRTTSKMEITRPLILCNDFSHSLSCAVYHDIPYYTYINTEGDLLVHNAFDPTALFQLASTNNLTYHSPLLCVCENELFLLFLIENPMSGDYLLKYARPLKPNEPALEISTFPTLPHLQCLSLDASLLLVCSTEQKEELFVKKGDCFQPFLLKRKQELEEEQKQNETRLAKIEEELGALNSLLAQKEALLMDRAKTIESARKQYDTLMNTAYRYREEAEKWYTRYYSRKP